MTVDIDFAASAWVLTSAALVFLMIPAIGIFYAGIGRRTDTLSTITMTSLAAAAAVLLWLLFGARASAGPSVLFGFVGDPRFVFDEVSASGLPADLVVLFSAAFAAVAAALVAGAGSGRVRPGPWLLFVTGFVVLVYLPVSHWVWGADGWILGLGAIDFAGGTVVHIAAGAAALAVAVLAGRRHDWLSIRGHNLPLTLLGAGLLSVGWIGFNAGSALAPSDVAAHAALTTVAAFSAGVMAFAVFSLLRSRPVSAAGAASAGVAALVGITPGAAALGTGAAVVVGVVCAGVASLALSLKYRFGVDDSGDVAAVHLFPGLVGSVLIGVFAADGLLASGSWRLLGVQTLASAAVAVYAFGVSFAIGWLIRAAVGFSVPDGVVDVDEHLHSESAYHPGDPHAVFEVGVSGVLPGYDPQAFSSAVPGVPTPPGPGTDDAPTSAAGLEDVSAR